MNPSTPEQSSPQVFGLPSQNGGLALWREALDHLRHLSDEVWKWMTVFLIANGFILAFIIALLAMPRRGTLIAAPLGLLSILGVLLTLVARYFLKRHRIYYLQMLAKKSLLEEDLGLYRAKFANSNIDLAFPWRLNPEVIAEIRKDFEGWVQKSIRAPGTIARYQFLIYEVLIGIYVITLALSGYLLLR